MASKLPKELQHKVFFQLLKDNGLPIPVTEHKFHPVRRWRFDYAFLDQKIALEVEGGIWKKNGGRHNRPLGMLGDIEKYNNAAILGWRLIRTTPTDLTSKENIENLKLILNQ